ncbi:MULTISPECIES: TRAP transporter small permease [unclassified Modicisalibacter]|uniref:TRAP transporter small permease n=1 Tax=unclassified Modicisalibacter TaxID=2679913 RepID=UPI001CCA0FBD|nr:MULTISPECIES: TRAP transporter small permease [unclassified Modicisalibacter]MBZ9558771.1 TRAP transporter small permease [Modicisalibacter sp. R2A 31.J]MBZ9575338.1 TRAP transporter small permease [Modicisalibacter sp. MOD 31.J]
MLELFLRFERLTSRVALGAAVLMLIVSVSLGFYQVLTRFIFDAPSTWSEVMSRSTMIWCVFLAAAASFRGGYMMAVEVVYKLVPARGLVWLEGLIALCCVMVLAILLYFGIQLTDRVSSQMLSGMDISIAWAYAAIPTGAAFAILAVLARIAAQMTRREPIGPAVAENPPVEEHSPKASSRQAATPDAVGDADRPSEAHPVHAELGGGKHS